MLKEGQNVNIPLGELKGMKVAEAKILTAADVHAQNSFEQPEAVKPVAFKDAKVKGGDLDVKMPPMSIVTLTLK